MKALVLKEINQIRYEEYPKPEYSGNEVLVNIKAVGICGSDVAGFLGKTGRRLPPMIMGHEMSGVIVEKGSEVKKFNVGDSVAIFPYSSCGLCKSCKNGLAVCCEAKKFFGTFSIDGGMAEYLKVPEELLIKLPEEVSFEVGAFAEPLSVAYGAVKKVDINADSVVAIIGAGTIGQMVLALVKSKNPKKIIMTDVSDHRLQISKELGADVVVNAKCDDIEKAVKDASGGELPDIVFEAVGIEASVRQAVDISAFGSDIVLIGMEQKVISIDVFKLISKECRLYGSFQYSFEDFKHMVETLGGLKERIGRLINLEADMRDGEEVFNRLAKGDDRVIKAVLVNK